VRSCVKSGGGNKRLSDGMEMHKGSKKVKGKVRLFFKKKSSKSHRYLLVV